MNILIVHQYFLAQSDAGGSRWNQFAKYWEQQGHTITLLAGTVHYATGKKHPEYKGRFVVRQHESQNVQVLRCHVSESYNKSFLGRFWAYLSFVLSTVWAGLFYTKKCDVIVCTSPPLTVGLTGWILSRLKRAPMVFEVRDLWPESAIDTGVMKNKWLIKLSYWLEKKSYKSANWINVLTPAFEKSLIENKSIRPDRISMIPNGADLDIFNKGKPTVDVRQKHNLADKFVITYVGAHGLANHLIQILETARLLKEQKDIVFMLVGDGMQKAMLKQKTDDWQLDNVIFVDSVPKNEIVDYITASDACTAVLKKIDTFKTVYPNKVFDYMSAQKPAIIAIDGVARKLIEDADAGIYVEPENPQEFADAVLKLKEEPQLCKQLGQNGLDYVRSNFDRKVLAQKYVQILLEKVIPSPKQHAVK